MKRKIMRLFIAGLLISAIIIMSGCAQEEETVPTIPEETTVPPTPAPPVAQISEAPSTVKFGESVTFSGAASTDSDGNITSYEWDFGDGNTASGETVTYAYSDIGAYNVKLTVTDDDGLSGTTEVSMKVVALALIKIETTISTWRKGEQPYDIYGAIKEKLEEVGFEVVPEESADYDAILFVDYEEAKGDPYSRYGNFYGPYSYGEGLYGYGTDITCNLTLKDKAGRRMFEKEISATPPDLFSGDELYPASVHSFQDEAYFQYLGEIIASQFGVSDEVSVLIRALGDEDGSVQWSARDALIEIGEPAIEPLIQALNDEDWVIRWGARDALAGIGKPAVEPLIQALKDENYNVRQYAAEALGNIGDKRAIEPLTQALNDEDENVRYAAERALEKIRGY
jgi:PKD repeat protein